MRTPNSSCSVCGKQFYRRPSELKKWNVLFCRPCRSIVHKQNKSMWLNNFKKGSGWNKGMSKANGDILIYGKPRSQTTKQLIGEALKGKPKSSEHRKNLSIARIKLFDIIGRSIRRTQNGKYKWFRISVLERDNYTCQNCRSNDNLQVHHIKQFRHFPELAYDIDNALTLCAECHRKTNSWGTHKLVL